MTDKAYPLCEMYGFTSTKRDIRIAMMGLSVANHPQIAFLHEKVIQPYAKEIVNDFYDVLLSYNEIKNFILQRMKVERLKLTQLLYLKEYGLNFDTFDYFEKHLQVGQVHAQIALPLSYYQMSFRVLNELIIDYLVFHVSDNEAEILQYVKLVANISALDMSLTIETYHGKKIHDMSDSINALMDERESLVTKIDLDELTRTASRARVLEYVTSNLKKSLLNDQVFCVAMLDLDSFKFINDKYGHIVGDYILKEVAARMMGTLRMGDMLGRYGGEEFLLVLPGADLNKAKQITERICSGVNEKPFKIEEYTIPVTISIGVTEWKENDSEDIILRRADNALYEAKHQGRNQVIVMQAHT